MIQNQVQNAVNYLVPSSGGTHLVPFSGVFSAAPYLIDWRQFANDEFPFQPQGVFIDNSQGTGELTINIQPINWNVTCPPGSVAQSQFPAPNGQTCTVTGLGQATVVFADFPVLPNAGAVTILGTANVNIVSPDPLPATIPVNVSGAPYQVAIEPAILTYVTGTAAAAGANLIAGAPINTYLRKLELSLPGNVSATAAAETTITVSLNGANIYTAKPYIPIAAGTTPGDIWERTIDFEAIAANVGAAGTLSVNLSQAITTGALVVNAWFD